MMCLWILMRIGVSFGQWVSYVPEESPKTVKIDKKQILLINYPDPQEKTLKISIPFFLSKPRYTSSKGDPFAGSYNFFYFHDPATVEMHFLNNISYYIDNATGRRSVTKICDFLLENYSFNCNNYFKISPDENKPFDTSRSYGLRNNKKEIQDFPSLPPHSLKILSTKSLLSKSKIFIDVGNGKEPISTYYFNAQILPFTANLYISYNICNFYCMKKVSVKNNITLSLSVDDIPKQCYSYSTSISLSSDLPNDISVQYQVNDGPLSEIYYGKVVKFSKNFIFTVIFYMKNDICNEYSIAKMITVDDPFTVANITFSKADIPNICLNSNEKSIPKSGIDL